MSTSAQRRKRKRQHDGKIKHKTEKMAMKNVMSLMKKTTETIRAYKCEFCDGWHIGRSYKFDTKPRAKINVYWGA